MWPLAGLSQSHPACSCVHPAVPLAHAVGAVQTKRHTGIGMRVQGAVSCAQQCEVLLSQKRCRMPRLSVPWAACAEPMHAVVKYSRGRVCMQRGEAGKTSCVARSAALSCSCSSRSPSRSGAQHSGPRGNGAHSCGPSYAGASRCAFCSADLRALSACKTRTHRHAQTLECRHAGMHVRIRSVHRYRPSRGGPASGQPGCCASKHCAALRTHCVLTAK